MKSKYFAQCPECGSIWTGMHETQPDNFNCPSDDVLVVVWKEETRSDPHAT